MEANASSRSYVKAVQALITAAASILGILLLIATMDVWPVLRHVYPIALAIVGVAAIIGAAWKSLAWYLAAFMGAVVGFVCAFGVAIYAVSRI
jgi:hypothetical protein